MQLSFFAVVSPFFMASYLVCLCYSICLENNEREKKSITPVLNNVEKFLLVCFTVTDTCHQSVESDPPSFFLSF